MSTISEWNSKIEKDTQKDWEGRKYGKKKKLFLIQSP